MFCVAQAFSDDGTGFASAASSEGGTWGSVWVRACTDSVPVGKGVAREASMLVFTLHAGQVASPCMAAGNAAALRSAPRTGCCAGALRLCCGADEVPGSPLGVYMHVQ